MTTSVSEQPTLLRGTVNDPAGIPALSATMPTRSKAAASYNGFIPRAVERKKGGLAAWQIERIAAYIDNQLHAKLSVKVLASQVYLSEFHFCRAFRLSFGVSPHNYVTRCRIDAAKMLLTTTQRPIGDIALECGAADQAHFTNLFRRCAGQTPGSWRRGSQGAESLAAAG